MTPRAGSMTPRQLARAIGVSEASVKRWCDQGLIATTRTPGGHRRLVQASVDDFLERTGRPPLDPDSQRVQSLRGSGERTLARGRTAFLSALLSGNETLATQIVADLHAAGHHYSAIADDVISAAEQRVVQSTETGFLQRQAATEVCARIVDSLRSSLPEAPEGAPLALVAALDGARSTLSPALSVLVLRDSGWNAELLGVDLPFATLCSSIRRLHPRLLVLQVDEVRNPPQFLERLNDLRQAADQEGTRLLTTGRGLSEELGLRPDFIPAQGHLTFRELQIQTERRASADSPLSTSGA